MKSVFLSDAHLKSRKDKGYEYLLSFFDSIRGDTENLFIVGDFFDFWFCDDKIVYPDFRPMVDKILELNEEGVRVSLFEGNHDFFLADYFEQYGIKIFPGEATIDLDRKKIFVSHGDTVSTSNKSYLLLRRFLRSRFFYRLQKGMPAPILWKISTITSKMSRRHFAKSPAGIAESMKTFSIKKFDDGYDAVVLGHCHLPLLEQYMNDGRVTTFAALGDWINHFSYLTYDKGKFILSSYR